MDFAQTVDFVAVICLATEVVRVRVQAELQAVFARQWEWTLLFVFQLLALENLILLAAGANLRHRQ